MSEARESVIQPAEAEYVQAHEEIVRQLKAIRTQAYYEHQRGGIEGGGYWQDEHALTGSMRVVYGPGWIGQAARQWAPRLLVAPASVLVVVWLIWMLGQ